MRFRMCPVRVSAGLLGLLWLGASAHAQDWVDGALGRESAGAVSATDGKASGKQANAPAADGADLLAQVLAFFSGPSTKQSTCFGSSLFHIEEFADTPEFKKADIEKWAKATVRLRITHAHRALALMEPIRVQLGASDFSLAGLAPLAGMDEGICTGTLIARNVVLTAGHCLTEAHWDGELGVAFPYFTIKGRKQSLTPAQFAKLLVADFDYQLNLGPVASSNDLAPAPVHQLKPFAVHSLVDMEAPNAQTSLDFAILRLLANTSQISEYALGANKIRARSVNSGEPVAIIQHPGGSYKKVATGTVVSTPDDTPLRYTASTAGGSSGAAILTRQGELVGIHTDGRCGNEDANLGLRLQRIRRALLAALRAKADQ